MIKTINGKKSLFYNDKEILIVSCYDIIMKLSELSEDYIAEMPVKLGLLNTVASFVSQTSHDAISAA